MTHSTLLARGVPPVPAAPGGTWSWPRAVALHLAPGAALLAFYLAAAPVLRGLGLPPLLGLLAGIGLVIVPIEAGLVVGSMRRRGVPFSASALGLRRPTRSDLPALGLATAAALLLPGVGVALEPWLASTLFGWLPEWFGAGLDGSASWSTGVQVAVLALWFGSAVVLGPIAEELYFRGWLLPRMPGGRVPATVAGAALFSLYHFWQPQAFVTVLLFALPLTVLVRRRGSVTLSILVHCGINLIAFAALLAGALTR